MDAKQTPLIDLLESVPADAGMVYEHDQFHSQNIPVGRLFHEAAAELRRLSAASEREKARKPTNAHDKVYSEVDLANAYQRGWDNATLRHRLAIRARGESK